MKIVKKIKKIIKKLMLKKGYKTNRQIVVFESDDWGAVRVSNKENFKKLKSKYPSYKFDHYQSLDTLETDEDITLLAQLLKSHKDSKNNPAKFTLNFATMNPDFDRIKEDNYNQIYLESIVDSYHKGSISQNVLGIVKSGTKDNIFMPQLHSREHFNSQFLLDDLKTNPVVKDAFDLGIIGVANDNYCALDSLNNTGNNKQMLGEAYQNFADIFGFQSRTFIAPCYVWDKTDEEVLSQLGIEGLQAKIFQNLPQGRDKYKKVFHKFGSENRKTHLVYTARNCFFEPSREVWSGLDDKKIIDNILQEIDFAFSCKKPAVICCHRVNFASNISKENLTHSLELLDKLLTALETKYKNLEYMFSTELLDTIKEKK